jgi:hypothetical protein
MLIPLGLMFTVAGAIEEARADEARRQMAWMGASAQHYARAKDLWDACTGPDACLLVIGGPPLANLALDGIPLGHAQPATGTLRGGGGSDSPYRGGQASTLNTHGEHAFVAVCPGLHRLSALVAGQEFHNWFTLMPHEARSFVFDLHASAWRVEDASEEKATCERALAGPLFDYNAYVAGRRVQHTNSLTSREAVQAAEKWTKTMADAITKFVPDKAFEVAAAARNSLVGVPMPTFASTTDQLGFHAFELHDRGRTSDAVRLIDAGLVMLPDAPTLLAVGGELRGIAQNSRDMRELPMARVAREMIERALRRDGGLAPQIRERAARLLSYES